MKTTKSKSVFLTLLILLGSVSSISAQQFVTQVKPADSDFWGYANSKGELIIPAKYSKCFEFTPDGFAVTINPQTKLYEFINLKGEALTTEITDFKLQGIFGFEVKGFSNGLVAVRQEKLWGFLNTQGKIAIPVKYEAVTEFNDGFATARLNKKFVILTAKGDEIAIAEQDVIDVKSICEGLAPYRTAGKLTGFIAPDGKVVIPAKFESVGYFTNGLAWAKLPAGQLGYINKKGEWVIQPQFSATKEFDEQSGLARVKTGEVWGYVNTKGEILNVNDTEYWGDFSEGLAEGKKGKKSGFYDTKGHWVIEPQFENVRDFKNGFASVKVGDKWGVINKEGKFVIQPIFSSIKDFELVK